MMMTAEKWHEYQKSYKRYGFDMRPVPKKAEREAQNPAITLLDRVKIISFILFAGLLCICIIVSAAYTADVKCQINSIIKENTVLSGEIENLNVKIKNATNIKTIEQRAIDDLGMIYPAYDQTVFLSRKVPPQGDFAMLLMEQAYN